jgi:K+-transporting ATPase KdpF subunit
MAFSSIASSSKQNVVLMNIILLITGIVLFGYLVYVLLNPEKF